MIEGDDRSPLSATLLLPDNLSLHHECDLLRTKILVIVEEAFLQPIPHPQAA